MTWLGWIAAAWVFASSLLATHRRLSRDRVRCVEDEALADTLRAVANAIKTGVVLADDADALRSVARVLEERWDDGG